MTLESTSNNRSNGGGRRCSGYVVVLVIVVVVVVAVAGHLCVLHLVSQTSESSSGSRRNCGGGRLEWLRSGVVLVVGEVVLAKILREVFRNTGFESHDTSIYSLPPPKKPPDKLTNKNKNLNEMKKLVSNFVYANLDRWPLQLRAHSTANCK